MRSNGGERFKNMRARILLSLLFCIGVFMGWLTSLGSIEITLNNIYRFIGSMSINKTNISIHEPYSVKGILELYNESLKVLHGYVFLGNLSLSYNISSTTNVYLFHGILGVVNTTLSGLKGYRYSGLTRAHLGGNFSITNVTIYSEANASAWVIGNKCVLRIHIRDPWGGDLVDNITIVFNDTAIYEFNRRGLLASLDPKGWLKFYGMNVSVELDKANYTIYFIPTENLSSILLAKIVAVDTVNNYTSTVTKTIPVIHLETLTPTQTIPGRRGLGGVCSTYLDPIMSLTIFTVIIISIILYYIRSKKLS